MRIEVDGVVNALFLAFAWCQIQLAAELHDRGWGWREGEYLVFMVYASFSEAVVWGMPRLR